MFDRLTPFNQLSDKGSHLEQVRTGAIKDLAQALRKSPWRIPLPLPSSQRQLAGPSSFGLIYAMEVFFSLFAVAVLFHSFVPPSTVYLNYAGWHGIFIVLVLLHAAWLMYVGLRREYSAASVIPATYITYAAYIFWPFALHDNASSSVPWCWFLGLYGMIVPLCIGGLKVIIFNIFGYSAALAFALIGGNIALGTPIDWPSISIRIIYFAALAIFLATLFGVARIFAERSDVFYAETLSAQLRLTRTRDQSNELQEFDKLVHDNVMAALLDASRAEGPVADRTRTLARRALAVLEEETNKVQPIRPVTFQELTEQIANGIYPWNSRLRFVADNLDRYPRANPASSMPPESARAFTHAVTEAVSNSARHSGTRTTQISVRTELHPTHGSRHNEGIPYIYCTVADFGQGFNMKNLDLRRMGVRVSMIRSMEEAGGKVTIKSAPYRGTEVIVQWPGDSSDD